MANELIEKYVRYHRRKKSKTKEDRKNILSKLRRDIGKGLDEVEREDVQDWIESLDSDGIKPSSINQYLSVVKHFYDWLRHELPSPTNQEEMREAFRKQKQFGRIQDIGRLEEDSSGGKVFEPDEILKIVDKSERRFHAKIFVLSSYFSFRRDEVRLLTKDNVDFEDRKVKVARETTKNPQSVRELPFHPWIKKLLEESKGKYVIGGKKPYSQSTFHWNQYDDVFGYRFRTKTFRRSFNTNMRPILEEKLGSALGDYMLKTLMGHSTSGSDMSDHYTGETESFEEDKRKSMEDWHFFAQNGLFKKLDDILF